MQKNIKPIEYFEAKYTFGQVFILFFIYYNRYIKIFKGFLKILLSFWKNKKDIYHENGFGF